jgi:hypothetical protein
MAGNSKHNLLPSIGACADACSRGPMKRRSYEDIELKLCGRRTVLRMGDTTRGNRQVNGTAHNAVVA